MNCKNKPGTEIYTFAERRRRERDIGNFSWENSRASKLVKDCGVSDKYADLVHLICEVSKGNNLKQPNRSNKRSKNGAYKFIEDNYDIFEQCLSKPIIVESATDD